MLKGIRRGANINLIGEAEKILNRNVSSPSYSVKPTDFFALTPKLTVKEGDSVKAGTSLFFSKKNPAINFVSPVSGKVTSVIRGAKRKVLEIMISEEGKEAVSHKVDGLGAMNQDTIKELLLKSGCWSFIVQRPYGIVANPDVMPKAVFVAAKATGPLQVDYEFILKNSKESFQKGIDVLKRLTQKEIYLGVDAFFPGFFETVKNVNTYPISNTHPAGNVSFHIEKLAPINPNETVWVVHPEDVVNIGILFETGKYAAQRTLAMAGPSVKKPQYYATKIGASLAPIIAASEVDTASENRYINGDALSGVAVSQQGHAGFYNNLVTVIPEGKQYRLFGWLPFKDNRVFSLSKTSFSWILNARKKSHITTNMNGEARALVVTGEMEKVFPMDMYPMQLLKACLVGDIEEMEALGIYEVVPEDFGLVDFSNTSKIEAQEIIREGIELMLKEVG